MKKITLFLASSKELRAERERFELEIYRKSKAWFERGIFLHLDIWEDLSARMAPGGSQSEYDKKVRNADLFILLAHTKVGMYTAQEFEQAFGQFEATTKPFIFTYFKTVDGQDTDPSLAAFHQKLKDLGHFYCPFTNADDLWNQFNKELERLETDGFVEFKHKGGGNTAIIDGNGNIVIQDVKDSPINIKIGNMTQQNAEKIYNIDKIDNANFS